jgi:hypothetical protein
MPSGRLLASRLVVRAPSVTGMIVCAVPFAGFGPVDRDPDGFGTAQARASASTQRIACFMASGSNQAPNCWASAA